MPVVVVGVNHKTASLELLERLTIPLERLPKALHQLGNYEHILEGVVVSTCNRTEVYCVTSKFHGGVGDMRNFLGEFCHLAPEDFADALYTYHDDAAIRHLFRVAAGLDSMILGESEIQGQLRRSFGAALEEGLAQQVLGAAFRSALRVGKRARTETSISRNPVSFSTAAVDLARREVGDVAGKAVTIVGSGEMARLAGQAFAAAGAGRLTVVNRTQERAHELAAALGATPRTFDELEKVVGQSDIVVSSTTAVEPVVHPDVVSAALAARGGHSPLVAIDMAMPRDFDARVADLPGVVLRDISDMRDIVELSMGSRLAEMQAVDRIIAAELERFLEWERSGDAGPTASALVQKAEAIRSAEVKRLERASLTTEQQEAVERATKRIVAKLVHTPLTRAHELAGSKQGYVYLSAIRELFDLDDEP
jgi:glutamyl-tRNA reductase